MPRLLIFCHTSSIILSPQHLLGLPCFLWTPVEGPASPGLARTVPVLSLKALGPENLSIPCKLGQVSPAMSHWGLVSVAPPTSASVGEGGIPTLISLQPLLQSHLLLLYAQLLPNIAQGYKITPSGYPSGTTPNRVPPPHPQICDHVTFFP